MKKLIILTAFAVALSSQSVGARTNNSFQWCLKKSDLKCGTTVVNSLTFIPSLGSTWAYNKIFKSACKQHDLCYGSGKKTYGYNRSKCDQKFKTHMMRICNSTTLADILTANTTKKACRNAAKVYSWAVRKHAANYFNNNGRYCEYERIPRSRKYKKGNKKAREAYIKAIKERVPRKGVLNAMGLCLDVAGAINTNRTNIQIFECNNTKSQQWTFNSKNEIRNAMGRCLDVAGAINKNRTNVQLFDCNGTRAQKWFYNPRKEIRNAMGRCLDVAGAINKNRTNVQLFDCNGTKAQKWRK